LAPWLVSRQSAKADKRAKQEAVHLELLGWLEQFAVQPDGQLLARVNMYARPDVRGLYLDLIDASHDPTRWNDSTVVDYRNRLRVMLRQ
jgi:hypothetical protein